MKKPTSPMAPSEFPHMSPIAGVEMAATHIGFRYTNRLDYALFRLCETATVAGVFTTSLTRSAPVDYSCMALKRGDIRTIAVNSGNSNAFTGSKGRIANQKFAKHALKLAGISATPNADGILPVVCCATGVIGEVLNIAPLLQRTKISFDASWRDMATAICTSDTYIKGATATAKIGDKTVTINGIAKGSGMIAPNMATMLAYIFTDACIAQSDLNVLVKQMADVSFNNIIVDSDISTSDSVVLSASGKAGNDPSDDLSDFKNALKSVFIDLACQIVKDGEGASKFITINVSGAKTTADAKAVGEAIANSIRLKAMIAGEDALWGRIVAPIGKAKAMVDKNILSVSMGGIPLAENGEGVAGYDETPVLEYVKNTNIDISVNLNLGDKTATIWTCDLTHGYININADYRKG